MNTSYPLERWLVIMICPIVPLSATIVLALAAPGSAFCPDAATATLSTASVTTIPNGRVDDYQPPNNGGPGKTGGSGTRWH